MLHAGWIISVLLALILVYYQFDTKHGLFQGKMVEPRVMAVVVTAVESMCTDLFGIDGFHFFHSQVDDEKIGWTLFCGTSIFAK